MCDPKRVRAMTKSDLVIDVIVVFNSLKTSLMIVVIGIIRYWGLDLFLLQDSIRS